MEKLQIPENHNIPIYQREHFEKSACAIEGRNGLTPVYQCWFPKQRHYWNGWACPAFLTRKSFLEFTKRQFGDYDASNDDDFLIEYLSSIRQVLVGGEEAYQIMSGLCWDEVNENDES